MHATTLLLLRHGQTNDNLVGGDLRLSGWFDSPLSTEGREQAVRLANVLHDLTVTALYTSTLRRARDTAEVLGDAWDLPSRDEPDLREISCGALEGTPLSIVQRRYSELWNKNLAHDDDEFRWPEGESYREFRARALRALRRIAAAHRDERVAVVTHAGVVSQIVGAVHGTPPCRWDLWRPGNCSVTALRWCDGLWSIVRFDWRPLERSPADLGIH